MPAPAAFLVLPGLGLDSRSWQPTLADLGGERTAYVRLSPGYGRPASSGELLDPQALAQAALEAVPPGAGTLVVLGHSAGCQVAAHLAALAPDRVSALVLVGPTTDPRAASWPGLVRRWLATGVHESPRQVPVLARQYARTTYSAMARALEVVRHDALLETLTGVDVPVLVLRGRHDRIAPADWIAEVASRGGPGSRHLTLPAGAHMVPFTHGQLVADAVATFLDERTAVG